VPSPGISEHQTSGRMKSVVTGALRVLLDRAPAAVQDGSGRRVFAPVDSGVRGCQAGASQEKALLGIGK
jgi:hypothetical protein